MVKKVNVLLLTRSTDKYLPFQPFFNHVFAKLFLQSLDGILCGFYSDLYLKTQLKGKLTPIRFDAYLQLLFHPLILLGFGDTFFLAA